MVFCGASFQAPTLGILYASAQGAISDPRAPVKGVLTKQPFLFKKIREYYENNGGSLCKAERELLCCAQEKKIPHLMTPSIVFTHCPRFCLSLSRQTNLLSSS